MELYEDNSDIVELYSDSGVIVELYNDYSIILDLRIVLLWSYTIFNNSDPPVHSNRCIC